MLKEYRDKIVSWIKETWQTLNKWQRIAAIGGAAALLIALSSLLFLKTQQEYGVLFANLSEKDAAAILNQLKEENIPYRLSNEGTTISIPKKLIYEKRLLFASEGLPQSGIIGYEIFDKNNIGLTEFVQKLNYKRALEGELARTIQSFEEIIKARVHIMVPEPTLFIEDEKPATASVVLNLVPGRRLRPEQVEGIANLVAASVEGLEPENVTVIDSHGKIISDRSRRNPILELTASQLELQQRVEQYFEEKLATLLTGVVGPNNYVVRVTAELDFNQVERTKEIYDPESSTVRSQESDIQTGTDPNNPTRTENVITNYEISKTVERVVGGVGTIKRLSVAVMINGVYRTVVTPEGEEVTEYIPRSEEEIQKIASLVRNAIGFDETRNDQIEVTNLPFDLTVIEEQEKYLQKIDQKELIGKLLFWGSILLALITLFMLLRSIFMRLRPELPELVEEEEPELEIMEIPEATRARIQKREMLVEIAKDKPDEVAKLIKSWMIFHDESEEELWNLKI
ncbi:MAG: flagellar basal-body MS-ring/collar protein FliF [candidate division KSB1 bacterium]|nr:flagellar basal-body MS-ring/collar protein FliF [candidate division KSB1 bacterium]